MAKFNLFDGLEDPQISLERDMAILSLESDVLPNVISIFRNIVPSVNGKIKEMISTFNGITELFHKKESFGSQVESVFKNEAAKLSNINYVIYRKTLVTTPEGFKGTYLDYLKTLNRVMPELFLSSFDMIDEYNVILSSFINNQNDKIALKDHTNLYKTSLKTRESVLKEIDKFFVKNDSSKKYLGDVLDRLSDLEPIITEMKILERFYKNQSLDKLRDKVKKSVDLLDVIIKSIDEDSFSKVSGASAKNISEGAYEIGKLVEMLSLMHFKIDQTLTAVNNLFETIKKIN